MTTLIFLFETQIDFANVSNIFDCMLNFKKLETLDMNFQKFVFFKKKTI